MATLAELRAEAKRQKRKGYSKLKKAELEKLLDTPPPKPPRTKPVSQRVPIKQVQSPKKAPPTKKPATLQGKNILVKSRFYTNGEWINQWNFFGKRTDFKKGNKTNASLLTDDNYGGETKALYFWKDLPPTPLNLKKDGLKDYFNPLNDSKVKINKKLSDAEAKSLINKITDVGGIREAIGIYLNTPKEIKDAYPFAGVYEGEPVMVKAGMGGTKFSEKYGILLPDISPKIKAFRKTKTNPARYEKEAIELTFKTVGKILDRDRRLLVI